MRASAWTGVLLCSMSSATAWAQLSFENDKLLHTGISVNDGLGSSVAVDGDRAVFGSPFDSNANGFVVGSAFVFTRTAGVWSQEALLLPGNSAAFDVGRSVSIDGTTVVVGAPRRLGSPGTGRAFVFVDDGTGWTEQAELVPQGVTRSIFFGGSVSVEGDTLVIGASGDDSPIQNVSGTAYVYTRTSTTWSLQQVLFASDAGPSESFGASVSISGDTILVGAPRDSTINGGAAGSAYVFVRTSTVWTEEAKLEPAGAAAFDDFGRSVSLDGDSALIGAPRPTAVPQVGTAFVFERSGTTWTEDVALDPSTASTLVGDLYGTSVSLSNGVAMIGASRDDASEPDAGGVFLFRRTSVWTEVAQLAASDATNGDRFGVSVAVDGTTTTGFVGADGVDGMVGLSEGAVYQFDLADLLTPDVPLPLPAVAGLAAGLLGMLGGAIGAIRSNSRRSLRSGPTPPAS